MRTSLLKKSLRAVWTTFKVIYFLMTLALLGVIGYAAYLIHPLYVELEPTIPDEFYPNDKITWTFHRHAPNENVFQRLTVAHDGTNEIVITREMGDYDIDMLGPIVPWQPKRDPARGLVVFSRKNMLPKSRASAIFMDAVRSGALDIGDEPCVPGATLEIRVDVGLTPKALKGPDHISSPIAYPPEKWINRIYWQRLSSMINEDQQLKPLMSKVKYIKNMESELNDAIEQPGEQ